MLDTTGEIEDGNARDTKGAEEHLAVFVPELLMIAGERQTGTDAQAIQGLEGRLIANDRCRYGAEDGALCREGKIERLRDVGRVAARGDNHSLCLQCLVLARGIGECLPKRADLRFSVIVLFCLECPRGTIYLERPALGGFGCQGNVCCADQGDAQAIAGVEKRVAHRFGAKGARIQPALLGGRHDAQRGEETVELLLGSGTHDGFDECGVVVPLEIN